MKQLKKTIKITVIIFICIFIAPSCFAEKNCTNAYKTIGVLTSGGDSPGMNSAIYAIVNEAISKGIKVKGIKHGYVGLLNEDIFDMDIKDIDGIVNKGGTILHTARSKQLKTKKGIQSVVEICKKHKIDALIVIGGDGSCRGAKDISQAGIPCICLLATIDNDIPASDYTIGSDTAIFNAVETVDKIMDTGKSHNRCSVVEVMGRNCGYIALQTGISVGATSIVIPENKFDFEKDIIKKMEYEISKGKDNFIIIIAEGIKNSQKITEEIEKRLGIESRLTVIGYSQRGGSPTPRDRVLAIKMGKYAVELLEKDKSNRVIVVKNGLIKDLEINKALQEKRNSNETCCY